MAELLPLLLYPFISHHAIDGKSHVDEDGHCWELKGRPSWSVRTVCRGLLALIMVESSGVTFILTDSPEIPWNILDLDRCLVVTVLIFSVRISMDGELSLTCLCDVTVVSS